MTVLFLVSNITSETAPGPPFFDFSPFLESSLPPPFPLSSRGTQASFSYIVPVRRQDGFLSSTFLPFCALPFVLPEVNFYVFGKGRP